MTHEQERLREQTDKAISELVYPKVELLKAYNYYMGIRNDELYRYLEENFGIGTPTLVNFTPLIKKHIDALVGEYLGTPILPKVSCKDKDTIDHITRDRQLKINLEIFHFLLKKLKNSILNFLDGKEITDKSIEADLNHLIENINNNFVSEYEIAALNVIEYLMLSRHTDMQNKLKTLLLDLLITGYCFYRVKKSSSETNVEIEVLNPLNTFIDRNPESPYVKDSYRVVVRKWLTKLLILNIYGRKLNKEDLKMIKDEWNEYSTDFGSYYIRNIAHNGVPNGREGIYGNDIVPGYPDNTTKLHNLIPVYEVEWLETDNEYITHRYETIRINNDIYILKGKNEEVFRSKDNPEYCGLSVNGLYFLNRTCLPYSLMLTCAHLQD